MNNQQTEATGRPKQQLPWTLRLLYLAVGVFLAVELPFWVPIPKELLRPWVLFLAPLYRRYLPVRSWLIAHPVLGGVLAAVTLVLLVLLARWWLLFWNNQVRARVSGTYFSPELSGFPLKRYRLIDWVKRRPKGATFVGLEPRRGVLGWRWRAHHLTAEQRSMHTHVMGKTGSGKTSSVIWPAVLQDALDGKGVLVMDAKGSDENVKMMKVIAGVAGRRDELKVFSLPAWNRPQVPSHTYNMVYVTPRTRSDAGGDVAVMAERVFSVLPLGDNDYYNTQAEVLFGNLCGLLHGMVDEQGNGLVFTVRDLSVCLKGIGDTGSYEAAFRHCLRSSLDREAARNIENQVTRLGRDVTKAFSGLIGALDKFQSPLVNAYAPDIIFEDILEKNGLVYVQLPGNLFRIQAPAMGKVMLMDVQQEGSLRQVFRTRNQTPFAVMLDEFYNFADLSIVDSLNKLRDANLHYTLCHQSIADLELVSKEFATAVWDNTRTKFILSQDNPELCEKVSKSIGTHQVVEKTVRQQQGALLTSLTTGDASTKLVETFRLHPNAIKSLAARGQGYCSFGSDILPLAFSMLPPLAVDYALPRNDQTRAQGLRLEERFFGRGPAREGQRGPSPAREAILPHENRDQPTARPRPVPPIP